MTDKLVPSDPEKVMVIRELVPNVTTFSVPFARSGMFSISLCAPLDLLINANIYHRPI